MIVPGPSPSPPSYRGGMRDDMRAWLRRIPAGNAVLGTFDPETLPADPHELFVSWLEDAVAAQVPLPHAATLATSGPDARVLILKDLDDHGFWFATRSDGRKAPQIDADPHAVLVFFWPALARQVRVHGTVSWGSDAQSAADFRERPPHSRATAMLGRQSGPMTGEEDYAGLFAAATALAEAEPDAGSALWRAAALEPQRIEFWTSTATGQVRVEYSLTDGTWSSARLWP